MHDLKLGVNSIVADLILLDIVNFLVNRYRFASFNQLFFDCRCLILLSLVSLSSSNTTFINNGNT